MQQDEALSILNDFNEILQSEVYVDLERLRILARHGVPNELRGEVWKFLLGVEQADRSKELTSSKARSEEYDQIDKTDPDLARKVRGEVSRYQLRTPELAGKHYAERFTNIITAFLNTNRDVEYHPALITLSAPFIYTLEKECDAYFCFERLMQAIEEEVDLNEFTTSWLQYLLSKEMKFANLVRLWDSYFAMPDPLEFHPFVCLAILRNARENLEDLEQSEIRTMLLRLPCMDMQPILAEAYNLRHETMERQLFEESEMQ
ncbi:rab-GTPase-TBC domain-containing protein [Parasitella parasitica]|nr:rab-GTPase-TBC domain-containing protein [Parasitella parasitica]